MAVEEQTRQRAVTESPVPIPAALQIRSRRNPKWIALGIVAICLGAIASFFLYSQIAESRQVVAVRHTVPRGATIAADDLGTVRVGDTGGLQTVPAGSLDDLVGKVAAFDLVEGSLLPVNAVTDRLPPSPGKALIGVRVASGRAPVGFLPPGSPVQLVVLPADAGDTSGGSGGGSADGDANGGGDTPQEVTNVATIPAVVVNSTELDDGLFLNLELESGQAVDAASFAAQERMVVVREAEH
jgi:hypothetical protein